MSTGMRKWMEKDCPDIPSLPAEVSIGREELRQLRDELAQYKNERDALRARIEVTEELVRELQQNLGSGMWRVLREEVESWKELAAQFGRDADEAKAHLAFAKDELNYLRAKIEAMEKQFPICRVKDIKRAHYMTKVVGLNPDAWLYLAPGAQPTPSIPEGWKLVPIEPTKEMRDAWDSAPICEDDDAEFRRAYSEMIAAATEAKARKITPGAQPAPSVPEGFSREDLESVADGLDGYEKTVNVGNVTGEGDDHLESTTAYAARFIRAMLAAAPEVKS